MSQFGSSGGHGFGGGDDKGVIIGKVEDIKSAPKYGERRVVVREKSGRRSTLAIDMPTSCSSQIERKETYCFSVEEKADVRFGGMGSRIKSSSFRTYHCEDEPEMLGAGSYQSEMAGRFGGGEGSKSRRTRKFTSC